MDLSPTYCFSNSSRWNLIYGRITQENGSVVLNCHRDDDSQVRPADYTADVYVFIVLVVVIIEVFQNHVRLGRSGNRQDRETKENFFNHAFSLSKRDLNVRRHHEQTTRAGVMITALIAVCPRASACPPAHILVDEPRSRCCKTATPTGKKETPAKLNPEVHLS